MPGSMRGRIWHTLQGEGGAAAAAEQLVAEEAQEAAKAAAKKAKKQKAKARKQQARSGATEAAAAPSLQPQHALDSMATPPQLGSSTKGPAPDKDNAGQQVQLQHRTAQDSAAHPLFAAAAQVEQVSSSAATPDGLHAGDAAAADASRGADASFLDQLFCCPITKVPSTRPPLECFPIRSDLCLDNVLNKS